MQHDELIAKIKALYDEIVIKHSSNNPYTRIFRQIEGALSEMGFKCLGKGASRTAYGNGSLVVKIGSKTSNECEFESYQAFSKHPIFSQFVIPMYGMYGNMTYETLLFCEQAKKHNLNRNDDWEIVPKNRLRSLNAKQVFDKHSAQFDFLHNLFEDCHLSNIAVYQKNIVCIDFNCEYGSRLDDERLNDRLVNTENIEKLYALYNIDAELVCEPQH